MTKVILEWESQIMGEIGRRAKGRKVEERGKVRTQEQERGGTLGG
jgi:hypothetical protein